MTYSYDPAKIRMRGKDQMRFEIGDVCTEGGANTCVLSDEEYEAILEPLKAGNRAWLSAKLKILEAVLYRLSYQIDMKIDVLQYNFRGRAEHFQKLYDETKKQVSSMTSIPSIASSIQGTPPYFYKGMKENPHAFHNTAGPPFRKSVP